MMKNIYNTLLRTMAAIALVLGMNSCLDKYPGDYILAEDSLKTFKEAEQHLTGIYSAFMSSALYSGYLTLLPDIQADLVYAINGNSNTYVNQWQWDIRSTNPEIEAVYASLYTVIGECNFFLDKIGAVKASLIDDAEIEYLDYYIAITYKCQGKCPIPKYSMGTICAIYLLLPQQKSDIIISVIKILSESEEKS